MVEVGDRVRVIRGGGKGGEFTVDRVEDDIVHYAAGYDDNGKHWHIPLRFETTGQPRLEVLEPEDE